MHKRDVVLQTYCQLAALAKNEEALLALMQKVRRSCADTTQWHWQELRMRREYNHHAFMREKGEEG